MNIAKYHQISPNMYYLHKDLIMMILSYCSKDEAIIMQNDFPELLQNMTILYEDLQRIEESNYKYIHNFECNETLKYSGQSITDEEINKLINLKQLKCRGTNITNIDKLTNLEILCCDASRIKDVSKLIKLKELYCGYTEINSVNNLINLEVLYCSGSNITTVNKLVNLEKLYCTNTIIDLNDVLSFKKIDYICCYRTENNSIPCELIDKLIEKGVEINY